jgi:hypothetical protein
MGHKVLPKHDASTHRVILNCLLIVNNNVFYSVFFEERQIFLDLTVILGNHYGTLTVLGNVLAGCGVVCGVDTDR